MKNYLFVCISLVVLVAVFTRCKKKEPLNFTCDSTIISFQEDISPIFEQHCYVGGASTGCHSAWVYSWEGIEGYSYFGKIENSVLIECDMPPPQNDFGIEPLSDAQLKLVYCWYEQGAENN